MKTICFLVAMAALPLSAQIAVSADDLPQGGTNHTFQNLEPEALFDYASSGPGWIWDFSYLGVTDSTEVVVEDIGEASFGAQFVFNGFDPSYQADHFYSFLAIPDLGDLGDLPVNIEEVMGYHQIDNGLYTQVGLGLSVSGFEIPVAFEDVDEVHPVPLTATSMLLSTASYAGEVPATFSYLVIQTRDSEVDGYGTLLLPDGSSHEVLRLRTTVMSEDSIYVAALDQGLAFERETVTYLWLGDGGMPWMEVSTTLGIPTVTRYQGSAPTGGVNPDGVWVVNQGSDPLTLYPNPLPLGGVVHWKGRLGAAKPIVWKAYDAQGSCIASGRGRNVSTQGWLPGMYVLKEGATASTHRLLIQ